MLRIVRPNDAGQHPRRRNCLSLTDAERQQLQIVLRNLHRHFGTWVALAEAMGVSPNTLCTVASGTARGSASLILLAARVAGMPVEQVLSGKLGVAGRCPTCGRST